MFESAPIVLFQILSFMWCIIELIVNCKMHE